ncbi:hypothetical protein [Gordonia sp. (in: high G+C Gram-positive bacteria)]|uniref:hypothetical protein n=1 Tax=Gordonia sp. (in: high G+C Gram-positive bacteria) TaxID=84139 RepID=UPI0016A40E7C|nr:hypothetical protein [Gordonia sp. (in: high G+C Gram-positive bacteria)]NLG45936.1 hypothetical protein [Gordonia sp. (in: high G+C Gram-positive bacteria)]
MTAAVIRLDAIAAHTAAGFDAADRRYRDRTAAVRTARREPPAVRRLRARLIADADAADGVVPQLLLPAGLDAARPGVRRR